MLKLYIKRIDIFLILISLLLYTKLAYHIVYFIPRFFFTNQYVLENVSSHFVVSLFFCIAAQYSIGSRPCLFNWSPVDEYLFFESSAVTDMTYFVCTPQAQSHHREFVFPPPTPYVHGSSLTSFLLQEAPPDHPAFPVSLAHSIFFLMAIIIF